MLQKCCAMQVSKWFEKNKTFWPSATSTLGHPAPSRAAAKGTLGTTPRFAPKQSPLASHKR
jgi:hypothetical protein